MSENVRKRAYAKINLFLRVLGKKGEYHEIESLLQSVDLYDEITLSKREDSAITGDFPGDNSLIVLEKLARTFSLGGMHLSVKKNIPIGGGLGGSTADAAAAAQACAELWGLDLKKVKETAAPLFGDLAFQMTGGIAVARGFGEKIESLLSLPPFTVLLAFPKKGVSTKEAYALSDSFPKETGRGLSLYWALARGEKADRFYANDLLAPAMELNEEIAPLLDRMKDDRALLSGMTGSGSTLFSIYRKEAEAESMAKTLPCRTLITRTIASFS